MKSQESLHGFIKGATATAIFSSLSFATITWFMHRQFKEEDRRNQETISDLFDTLGVYESERKAALRNRKEADATAKEDNEACLLNQSVLYQWVNSGQLKNLVFPPELIHKATTDSEILNKGYKEVSDAWGVEAAMHVYRIFKGQRIDFPVQFFSQERIQKIIAQEYNGTNVGELALKYGFSEKRIRRIARDNIEG